MRNQRGMTFVGTVLMIAAIVFVAVITMKLTPSYLEYMSVKKAINNIANNPDFRAMGKKEIYDSFSKTAAIDNISSIKANELIITQSDLGPVVIAESQVVVP